MMSQLPVVVTWIISMLLTLEKTFRSFGKMNSIPTAGSLKLNFRQRNHVLEGARHWGFSGWGSPERLRGCAGIGRGNNNDAPTAAASRPTMTSSEVSVGIL